MIYEELKTDLFEMPEDYYFAQCISADFAMGKGIAVEFNKHFNTKQKIMFYSTFEDRWDLGEHGTCLLTDRVYNLITKRNYWMKPTYETLQRALDAMVVMVQNNPDVKHIAMPKIGCGLDRLSWPVVSAMIQNTFQSCDVHIIVCYL